VTLKIEKHIQEGHTARLIVEADDEIMDRYKRRAAARISARSKIPGFRPGKAPYEIVVRQFGEGAVTEEAVNLFVDSEYQKILEEAQIKPAAAGTLESVDSLTPPKFTFSIPLAPEVDLGDYKSVRHPYNWQEPGEEDLEAAIEDMRQTYAATETVDRPAGPGDYLLLDLTSDAPELNRTGFASLIREQSRDAEWPYPGFANELIGLKAGERKTIDHTFPNDWKVEELRNRPVKMEVNLKTVRGVSLPDLDDAFAKLTGAGETIDALRETVRKDVRARSQAAYDDDYFVELIEKVRKAATIKYHAHTVEHEEQHILENLSQRLAQQGMDLDTFFKVRKTTREKYIEQEVQPAARKRLERGLILDEIIRREGLGLDDQALDEEYRQTVDGLAMRGLDFSKLRGGRQGQKRLSEAIALDAANRVITRKALDLLKAIATGTYKPAEPPAPGEEEAKPAAAEAGS
jgi:trigger factor